MKEAMRRECHAWGTKTVSKKERERGVSV